jgi:hypothetical protein
MKFSVQTGNRASAPVERSASQRTQAPCPYILRSLASCEWFKTGDGPITELALSLRRKNGNAAHALAHALYEQGDIAAGSKFLADWLPTYDRASFLNGHISWHFALLALGSNDVDKALDTIKNVSGRAFRRGLRYPR